MNQGKRKGSHAKRLAKSVSHPIRIDVLRVLGERPASPGEIAKALGENLSEVSYHVADLVAYGCIELERTEPRRGARQRYYRVPPFFSVDDLASRKLSQVEREEQSVAVLQTTINESIAALRLGTLDSRTDKHLSWMPIDLDEEGWGEVISLFARTLADAEAIKAKSAERIERSGETSIAAIVSMMAFERSRSCCE